MIPVRKRIRGARWAAVGHVDALRKAAAHGDPLDASGCARARPAQLCAEGAGHQIAERPAFLGRALLGRDEQRIRELERGFHMCLYITINMGPRARARPIPDSDDDLRALSAGGWR